MLSKRRRFPAVAGRRSWLLLTKNGGASATLRKAYREAKHCWHPQRPCCFINLYSSLKHHSHQVINMSIPISTYRIQLSPAFTLEDLGKIVDYLEQLQIGTVYAAPFFQAKEGSTHGYDVANPWIINPAIGDLEAFRTISKRLKSKGIGWLQDIVPNHMANHPTNPWLYHVLELGPESPYYRHFDINWESRAWPGQVMVPVLGAPEEEVLAQGEIQL